MERTIDGILHMHSNQSKSKVCEMDTKEAACDACVRDGWRFDKNKEVVYCSYYIKRKKRQCTHRVSANSDSFCSEHSPASLAESRISDLNARSRHESTRILSDIVDKISQGTDTTLKSSSSSSSSLPRQKRMRVSAPKRMANPFSIDLTPSISHIQPADMFSRPERPLHIDIGCAKGRCIERMSKRPERKEWNHLGVEIRGRTVDEAMERVAKDRKRQNFSNTSEENKNLFFLTCNFAASVKELLDKFPRESLRLISIQFPDPWKRKKHQRRLIVQKKLVNQLALSLPPGAVVYISSDCDDVATWMVDIFEQCTEDTMDADASIGPQGEGERPKKKCFRLLSSQADLDSVSTLNMFMKQTCAEREHQLDSVSTESKSKEEVQCTAGEEDDDTEDNQRSAESYSWFEANNNPLGELSERELVCEVDWRGVRRCCFMRM